MEEVEYLYHYTSIESLALILKNKTIRLNPLDKMDDLQEQKTADVENLGKFVFVSSWTNDHIESIPMWKMYTKSVSGVRIRMRKNPFIRHRSSATDVAKARAKGITVETGSDGTADTFINIADMIDNKFYCVQAYQGNILEQVKYVNDTSLLEPKVHNVEGTREHLDIGKLGLHKSEYWDFQKEWRYRMIFMRMSYIPDQKKMEKALKDSMDRMALGTEVPPFRYFDLDIAPKCFEEMEIACSPQMTYGNRVILETLVEKYNPSAKIIESELLGKI